MFPDPSPILVPKEKMKKETAKKKSSTINKGSGYYFKRTTTTTKTTTTKKPNIHKTNRLDKFDDIIDNVIEKLTQACAIVRKIADDFKMHTFLPILGANTARPIRGVYGITIDVRLFHK
ncbi:hypothetical protein DERP_011605 [Dermatophagoides pteronyssinus]|uniref:Uncharacterized protein n=1 Tax=Dermatophagoides pteronyssinus TaxID=6956 RepID=A0ABQ8JWE0_DERPT|nr:hypothetical protein DERP_011605 [Dermatophagoides pteronyssinus]